MKTTSYSILVLIICRVAYSSIIYAETSMNLILSVELPDSLKIKACESVGDFNADEHNDLLVGVSGPSGYRAAYLYYGGPQFDEIPDLEFKGEMCMPQNNAGGFGEIISGLGDFNGDGIDDIAVGAQTYNDIVGRIYIYYGSPNPDTTADMIINGNNYYDGLPFDIVPGDYNGDGLGDFLTGADNPEIGPRMMIYLGGEPPDTIPGIIYDYTGHTTRIFFCHGSSDINGDGIDDYGWEYWESNYYGLIFLGSGNLNEEPIFTLNDSPIKFCAGDVDGDGVDDFLRASLQGWFLCLGGSPLDVSPDYYTWYYPGDPFLYRANDGLEYLIKDETNVDNRFIVFHATVPFDTIPLFIFDYGLSRTSCQPNVYDINADGNEEIALPFNDTTSGPYINIYQITFSGISDDNGSSLPDEYSILSCYPNPFNSSVMIKYPSNEGGEIRIYNLLGQQVKLLCTSVVGGQVVWDGTDNQNMSVPSGVYFARVKSSGIGSGAKLLLLR